MKRFTVLLLLLVSWSSFSFAKKDTDAWKSEKNLDQQFSVFKENLKYWNGSYFLNELQINQFYGALRDSIAVYEKEVIKSKEQVKALRDELNSKIKETQEIQAKLDRSTQLENSISVFGVDVNKGVYSSSMYLLIIGVLLVAGLLFLLYKRSNKITANTKKDLEDLKEEFEVHKKNALDRYVKINTELTKARMELNRR
jgi:LPXTG-motif cell wall-anchored protein